MTSVLSIRNLRFSRGHGFRLDLPSLDVRPGERVLLAGPSGCGKSTLLWLVAGLLQAEAGEILVAGDRIDAMRESDRDRVRARRIGLVFQTHQLLPAFTAEENVSLALLAADEPERLHASRARELLAALGVNRPDAPIAELSGGQQQRVAVARALVNRPSVLLLDEPLGALDRKLREEMQIELKLLQSRLGITFVFVTHDQEEAMSMSDRIAIMLDGHIEQLGDPETVYEHPASAFVAGFIGRNNFWSGVATEHGARADDGTEFVASRPEEDVPNGQGALAAVRPECINLSVDRPTNTNNAFQGTVAGVSHFGDVLQYVVHTADRDVLVLTPRANATRLHAGDSVWASWSADDVYLFSSRQADIVLAEADEVSDE